MLDAHDPSVADVTDVTGTAKVATAGVRHRAEADADPVRMAADSEDATIAHRTSQRRRTAQWRPVSANGRMDNALKNNAEGADAEAANAVAAGIGKADNRVDIDNVDRGAPVTDVGGGPTATVDPSNPSNRYLQNKLYFVFFLSGCIFLEYFEISFDLLKSIFDSFVVLKSQFYTFDVYFTLSMLLSY